MTTQTATGLDSAPAIMVDPLPSAARVLAVTARPGQESADLGGLLYAFRRSGASLSLLCLTHGEAAGQGADTAWVEAARPGEVQMAASILGIRQVAVTDYHDGHLHHYHSSELTGRIQQAINDYSAGLVLVIAPETGDIGDSAVALQRRPPPCWPGYQLRRAPGQAWLVPGPSISVPTRRSPVPSRSQPPLPTPASQRRSPS